MFHSERFEIACKNGDLDEVKNIFQSEISIEKNILNGAIYFAAKSRHFHLVKFLIENGADIHTENDFPVRMASLYGDLDWVKYFVENGANIRVDTDYCARMACYKGHLEVVKYLIQKGANVRAGNDFAFRTAVDNGHFEVVKFLFHYHGFDHGHYTESEMSSVIDTAAKCGYNDILQFLLDKGFRSKSRALAFACSKGEINTVKFLLSKGANVNKYAALSCACEVKQNDDKKFQILQPLLEVKNINIHLNDDYALRRVCHYGLLKCVKLLVKKGANVVANDNECVKFASEQNYFEIVKVLIDHGADESLISEKAKKYISFCRKMENKRKIWAVNTIGSWWIPICYDVNRECGKRMMERSWKRVEEMYNGNV